LRHCPRGVSPRPAASARRQRHGPRRRAGRGAV